MSAEVNELFLEFNILWFPKLNRAQIILILHVCIEYIRMYMEIVCLRVCSREAKIQNTLKCALSCTFRKASPVEVSFFRYNAAPRPCGRRETDPAWQVGILRHLCDLFEQLGTFVSSRTKRGELAKHSKTMVPRAHPARKAGEFATAVSRQREVGSHHTSPCT